jgi:iron(III) transport system permease protein
MVLGLAGAVVLSIAGPIVRQWILALAVAVLALPSFLVTNCWIDLLGVNGILHRALPVNMFSLPGAVWILALLFWPIPALAVWSAWRKLEPVHFEIDPLLRGWRLCRLVLAPAAKPQLVLSAAIVFALALNNFAVPTILQVKVFTAEVWVQFNTSLDAMGSLRLSWPLIVVPLCLLAFLGRENVPWPRDAGSEIAAPLRRQLGRGWIISVMVVGAVALLLSFATPLVQLAAAPRTWSELLPALEAGGPALLNSITYAVGAAAGCVVLSLGLARVRGLGWLWLLFLGPGVLLGISALSAFNHPAFDLLMRTAAIVMVLLVLRYVALARSMTRAALAALDSGLIDAARLDGARGVALFQRITLPQIRPQLAAAAYIVYLLALWDVETILLVIPPGGETLALRVFNLLHYGHNAHVNALCFLLLLLAVAPLACAGLWKAVRRK